MKKAFALVLTLWIVAIMSLVSALYLSYAKSTVQKTKILDRKLKAALKIESTVELLKFYGMTGELLSNKIKNKTLEELFPFLPHQIFTDGRETQWGDERLKVQDIAGLIGSSDKEALASYFMNDENASKDKRVIIKKSLLDWLDTNGITNLNGAEEPFYRQQGYAYRARNENYIASLDEIFLLRGIVDKNLDKQKIKSKLILSPYVLRNLLTMDSQVLMNIYSFSKSELEQLMRARDKDNKTFLRIFYQLRPLELNNELTGVSSSRIMKVVLQLKDKEIFEKISFIISFRHSEFSVGRIIEYNN